MSMSPAQATTVIVILAVFLAVVSAFAGALWWQVRSLPLIRAGRLATELAERQRALEGLIRTLEKRGSTSTSRDRIMVSGSSSGVSKRSRRTDLGESTAVAGPTLIAVPDLAASPSPTASAELGRRFGAIWSLADAGHAPDEISRRSGQPIGQVELILGLRRQLVASGGRA
jgi:hypothetical protein